MQVLSDRIIFDRDDFLAGLVPVPTSATMRIFGVRGAAFSYRCDPLNITVPNTALAPGLLIPGGSPVALTGTTSVIPNALLVAGVVNPGTYVGYAIGGADLHKITGSTDTIAASGGFPATISAHGGHASLSFALGDVAISNVSGTRKLFFSWNDNTDWDVGVYDLSSTPPTGVDNDFMSTVPTTPLAGTDLTGGVGKPHPLYQASDGILYIGSAQYVHSYDPVTSTFVSQDLDLPVEFTVKGFAETDYDLVVFATNVFSSNANANGRAKAFFWDASRPESYYKVIDLEDDDVSAPFNYKGTIACFTGLRSSNTRATLRILQGNRFVPVFRWRGNIPGIKGVFVLDDLILWASGGAVYSWGAKDGVFPSSAQIVTTGSGTTDGGMLVSFYGSLLYLSSGTAGNAGAIEKFSGFNPNAFWHSMTACPNFPRGKKGKVKEVKVTYGATASGGLTLDLQLKTNSRNTTTNVFTGLSTITAATMVNRYTAPPSGTTPSWPEFENLSISLVWGSGAGTASAPIPEKIEVFYETIAIK